MVLEPLLRENAVKGVPRWFKCMNCGQRQRYAETVTEHLTLEGKPLDGPKET